MRTMILPAALISVLAIQSHAQTPALSPSYSVLALRMERAGNTVTLTGSVVIVINGIEIRTDKAVMVLPKILLFGIGGAVLGMVFWILVSFILPL